MWQAFACLPSQHDARYVAVATLVCVLGSLLSMRLLARARRNTGPRKFNLLFLSGLVAGGTVWTTHFAAMLGYDAPVARAFEPGLTFASLIVAIVFAWAGFYVAARTRLGPAIEAGGAVFGLGIAAMHFTGMAAFETPGLLVWNYPLVALSVTFAAGFGAVATNRIARPITRFCKYGGTLAMILAIVSLHFTGMAALTMDPVLDMAVPSQTLSDTFMITSVVVGLGLIMAMAASAYAIDLQASQEASESSRQQALLDPLTGLPNRNGLSQQLHDVLAGGDDTARLVVLAIDLDRFKDINDVHGHAGGDHLLQQVAQRIAAQLQPGEFLARIGADEFVAVKSEIFARGDAIKFAERLRKIIGEPVEWNAQSLGVEASIGISLFPEHGATADGLTQRADLAMHRAKSLGRGKICTYEPSMDEASRARAALAIDLKRALAGDELELHYQVQNDTNTGDIVGFEALIRWNHPQKGRIPPDAFIPIAEETGLIIEIGDWVIRTACTAAARWPIPFKVAVNVAPAQLNHELPRRVAEILNETGLPPSQLEIELTESGIITDRQHALQIVLALKAIGVTVAMDDFGTGYSSLSTLQAFPFDKIKVDKSFIQAVETSVHAAAIVKATLLLARSLNIPVLAEGVETERHLAFLREEGCNGVQGYLFGRPMPVADVNGMVEDAWRARRDTGRDQPAMTVAAA